VETKWIISWAS